MALRSFTGSVYVKPDSVLARTAQDMVEAHFGGFGPRDGYTVCPQCGDPLPCAAGRAAAEVLAAAGLARTSQASGLIQAARQGPPDRQSPSIPPGGADPLGAPSPLGQPPRPQDGPPQPQFGPPPSGPAVPGQVAPGQVAPGQVAPGQVAPGQVAPGQVAPGQVAPGQVAPGSHTRPQVQPGQIQPNPQMQPGLRSQPGDPAQPEFQVQPESQDRPVPPMGRAHPVAPLGVNPQSAAPSDYPQPGGPPIRQQSAAHSGPSGFGGFEQAEPLPHGGPWAGSGLPAAPTGTSQPPASAALSGYPPAGGDRPGGPQQPATGYPAVPKWTPGTGSPASQNGVVDPASGLPSRTDDDRFEHPASGTTPAA
jgi:hypothetical protein